MIEDPNRQTRLPFELELLDGSQIKTLGHVEKYLRNLNDEQHESNHWGIATRMFANAMNEPAFLKAATMSFQTALVLDGLLQFKSPPP